MEETQKEGTPQKEGYNIMAIAGYLGFLCLIPILTKDKDEFVNFHARQGLVLLIAELSTWIIFGMGPFFWLLSNILGIVLFALSAIGIKNVLKKEKKELPVIGRFAEKIKL